MRYRIQDIPHPEYNNQLLPVLVDADDCFSIEPSAALWGWQLWLSKPFNTVRSRLRDLTVFYEYVDSLYPDFFSDAAGLKLMTLRRVHELTSFLLINFQKGKEASISVLPSTYNRRVDSVVAFLDFHYSRYVDRLDGIEKIDIHRGSINRLLKQISKTRYKESEVDNAGNPSEPISEEEMDLIRSIVRPSTETFTNEVNPYRNQLQLRNACLLEMLYELGCRASELVLIRANDQDLKLTTRPTVVIQSLDLNDQTRSRNRRDGASHKTRNRELPISIGLADLLVEYLENDRPIFKQKNKGIPTEYLFVSEKDGGPLTTDGLDYVISALYKKIPELKNVVHPHRFRVSRGIALREGIDEKYEGQNSPLMKAGEMQDVLTTWGGWSSTSNMPKRYTNAHIQRSLHKYLSGKKS